METQTETQKILKMKPEDRFEYVRKSRPEDKGLEGIFYNDWVQIHNKKGVHRVGMPASLSKDGYVAWYENNQRHNLEGPAVIRSDNSVEYWIRGKQYTEQEFKEMTTNPPTTPQITMPKQDMLYIDFPIGTKFQLHSGRQYRIEQDGNDFTVLSWSAKGSKREILAKSFKECAEIIHKLEYKKLRADSKHDDPFKHQHLRAFGRANYSNFTTYSEE